LELLRNLLDTRTVYPAMKTLAAVVLCVLVAACATPVPSAFTPPLPTPTAASSATESPTSSPMVVVPPVLTCGDLAIADCLAAESAILAQAAGQYGRPTRVELGRGVWCPTPGLLFKDTTCPAGGMPPPDGGQWIGHGLVTFAGSPAQAYLNVAKNDQIIRGTLVALATPPPETPAPS
jgi:hypothetical protein